jgi:uncharacterized coiled-coil protein SlyX
MAQTCTNDELEVREAIAEHRAAVARIDELIKTLENRLIEIQTHNSEAAQLLQDFKPQMQSAHQ